MSKRFGIDARWITPEISGIGRYTERLIRTLAQLDSQNHYFLFFSDAVVQSQFHTLPSNFKSVALPYSPFSLKGMWVLRQKIKELQLDLFHSTNFMLPLLGPKIKYVATVHDLIPLIHPEFTPKAKKTRFYFVYSLLMKHIARKCDLILTDSDHSKQDVRQALKVPEPRVKRIYIGIDEKYKPKNSNAFPAALTNQYQVKPPYFLYVGRHDPYKNILGMVQAYAQYLKEEKNPIPLVVTGKRDPRYPEAYRYCEENNLLGKIIFTGYVSDVDLLDLYQHAHAVVLVSRYEGFGLPVLEAMACGVPVLCSQAASLPEVSGQAALTVSADSLQEIATAFSQLTPAASPLRQSLITKGFAQSKKFCWKTCAQETLHSYLKTLQLKQPKPYNRPDN